MKNNKTLRLTESQLQKIIKESINNILENDNYKHLDIETGCETVCIEVAKLLSQMDNVNKIADILSRLLHYASLDNLTDEEKEEFIYRSTRILKDYKVDYNKELDNY